jgi:hypothetical protein
MNMPTQAQITRRWIERVVIGHQLCPFAQQAVEAQRVRYRVSGARDDQQLWAELVEELTHLQERPAAELETSLLIHPQVLGDFDAYLGFVDLTEQLLVDMELEGVLQIATFHPDYQFADTDFDDPANYTNRAPYPMLHLLREASVEAVVAAHPDPEGIPDRNVALMRSLGIDAVQAERESVFEEGDSEV